MTLASGEIIVLRNAVEEGLTPMHIHAAREKCGYVPATRAALHSSRVRHEIVETRDGELDDEADPMGALYLKLEEDNNMAVEKLVQSGFNLAFKGRRTVKRMSANQVAGREQIETVPGSRERQDLLAKCKSAEQHFCITGGGGLVNSTDALIGKVRQKMLVNAEAMRKEKDAMEEWEANRTLAQTVLQEKGDNLKNWLKPELRALVAWMIGPCLPEGKKMLPVSTTKAVYVNIFKNKYKSKFDNGEYPEGGWTDSMETELNRLESGDVGNLDETGLMKEAFEREEEFLRTRLSVLPNQRVRNILEAVDLEALKQVISKRQEEEQG